MKNFLILVSFCLVFTECKKINETCNRIGWLSKSLAASNDQVNNYNYNIKKSISKIKRANKEILSTLSTNKMEKPENEIREEVEDRASAVTELLKENKLLKDKIAQLEEKLKQSSDKERSLNQLRQTFEIMKLDRKRLKCEKLELLNQTRDLYQTIESKENEFHDILKHFETKTRETSLTVKKLLDHKADIEEEKNDFHIQLLELVNVKNELQLVIESKNANINKLNKEIFEVSL